jgi:hypothetical protein
MNQATSIKRVKPLATRTVFYLKTTQQTKSYSIATDALIMSMEATIDQFSLMLTF